LSACQREVLIACNIPFENSVNLTDAAVLRAYAESDLVTFVSLAEGFGLPIIEANAIGRPVVTSDIRPMSDIAGNSACLVNPHDVRSIRSGLERVLTDDRYREELVERGFRNAARFTPETVAQQYMEVYNELVNPLEKKGKAADSRRQGESARGGC